VRPLAVERTKEKWPGRVFTVSIGATAGEGGTRGRVVTIGGHTALPFVSPDDPPANRPVIAMIVRDDKPRDWPETLARPLADVLGSPVEWAQKCVEEYGAEVVCLSLASTHPDRQDASPDQAAKTVRAVLDAVPVPLMVVGCGHHDKDNEVWPRITDAARGERCLMGIACQENYRTLVAACMADGHSLIAEAPIDINIQKQLNILVTEMGLPPERIVLHPGNASLGYGLEYEYSIMERIRLAGLQGDRMLAQPMLAILGEEVWKAKEARLPASQQPAWGDETYRGPAWEAATGMGFLVAGADLLAVLHPEAVLALRRAIDAAVTG